MSKINVNTWEPEGSSTDAVMMASSDTVTVPSGAELDIASGATLDVNGTIDLTGATKTGFPAGGLTTASQWRLTTDFTGAATPIVNPGPGELLEVGSPVGFGVLGSSMACSTGGIFTYPSTGYWLIFFHITFWRDAAGRVELLNGNIQTTTDDGTYADASVGYTFFRGQPASYTSATSHYIFDVTSTSTHKCRFTSFVSGTSATTMGDAAKNETFMTFIKLADT